MDAENRTGFALVTRELHDEGLVTRISFRFQSDLPDAKRVTATLEELVQLPAVYSAEVAEGNTLLVICNPASSPHTCTAYAIQVVTLVEAFFDCTCIHRGLRESPDPDPAPPLGFRQRLSDAYYTGVGCVYWLVQSLTTRQRFRWPRRPF